MSALLGAWLTACLLVPSLILAQAPDTLWTRTFGGIDGDRGYSIQQVSDGGYIITGYTDPSSPSSLDVWLIKIDAEGDTAWTRIFGGSFHDEGKSIQQTTDGGYIIVRYTESYGAGEADVWLIKTDAAGDTTWSRTFGGILSDRGYSVQQTADGGYILTGLTNSYGAGGDDVWLIKTDATGDTVWTQTFGGSSSDHGYSIQQTADGGYIITGLTDSYGAGGHDVWLIKTDTAGDTIWTGTFGGDSADLGRSVQQTLDGGYIITGYTESFGAGGYDVWLIKTDAAGDTVWTQTFGGSDSDEGYSVQQTTDGGYIITGFTNSYGVGGIDTWLIKTDAEGDTTWTGTYGGSNTDYGFFVQQTTDCGYIVAGSTYSYGVGLDDVWLLRLGSVETSGLVAWYPFNGNANDESGNGNDGTVNGATLAEDRFGNANSAYSFDGSGNYISLPTALLNNHSQISYFAWVKRDIDSQMDILCTRANSIAWIALGLSPEGGFEAQLNLDVDYFSFDYIQSDTHTVQIGEWAFLGITYDGERAFRYLNGISIDTTDSGSGATNVSGSVVVGRRATTGEAPFDGLIDDIRIYDRALSAAEIEALYHEGGWPIAPPSIVSTTPAQNALNVARDAAISVTFDRDMDAASLDGTTFIVHGSQTGRLSGAYSYDSGDYTATFMPDSPFKVGEQVSVTLTTGVQSAAGEALASPYGWSFTAEVLGGSGEFLAQTTYAAGDGSRTVYSADLDGDGYIDLAVSNVASNDVSVLLGNGDGTFAAQQTYAVGDHPYSVYAADLDIDGDLDLTTANFSSDNVSVLLGNGDGTFAAQTTYVAGDYPCSITAADLDGDGDLDLAVVNNLSDNISVLLGGGDGTFAEQTTYAAGGGSYSITSADLDGDGYFDLVVANPSSDNVSVLLGNGDGTFVTQTTYAAGDGPVSIVAADLDGDGDADLAVSNAGSDNISVMMGRGDGTFEAQATYAAGHGPYSLTVADIDGDGNLDLATANYNSDNISVLLGSGDGTFAPQINYSADKGPNGIATADLDGDGDSDLAVANYGSDNVSVLLNTGEPTPPIIVSTSPAQNALNVARDAAISVTFDRDMDAASFESTTFVVHGSQTGQLSGTYSYNSSDSTATFTPDSPFKVGEQVSVTLTTGVQSAAGEALASPSAWSFTVEVLGGSGEFAAAVNYGAGDGPYSVTTADLDGNGDIDLAVVNTNDNNVSVLPNDGSGSYAAAVNYSVGYAPCSAIAADLDGNGDTDLAVVNLYHNNVSVLLNDGSGGFTAAVNYDAGDAPRSITAGDLDRDGDSDLAVANYDGGNVSVLLGDGSGGFAAAVNYGVGSSPWSVTAADLDGDGDSDLAVANYAGGNVSVLLNNGLGGFATAVNYGVGDNPYSVTAADLDGDGDSDLTVANGGSDNVSVLLNDGSGGFAAAVNYSVGYAPCSVIAADLDGNGDVDLAVANGGSDNVSVLLNDGSSSFATAVNYGAGSYPVSVTAADLDSDGDLDLVVANASSDNVSVLLNKGGAPPVSGLVAYYPFNGNANDESGNGNDGTVYGATLAADRFGNTNATYSFDGLDDVIDLSNYQESLCLTSGSLSLWFKSRDTDVRCDLLSAGELGSVDNFVFLGLGDEASKYNDESITFANAYQGNIQQRLTMLVRNGHNHYLDDAWHHIVLVSDGTDNSIMVDGERADITYEHGSGTTQDRFLRTINNNTLLIGKTHYISGELAHYEGEIDDIRIYNRALSAAEIEALYHEGGWDPSLLAYYPFNGNANDESGNGYDGTVNGAALTVDRFGNPNNAYSFDGVDDYIYVPANGNLSFDASSESYSIVGFYKVDSLGNSSGENLLIISDRELGTNSRKSYTYQVFAEISDPNRGYGLANIWYGLESPDGVWTKEEVILNEWYHFAYVVEAGNTQNLYINGELDSSESIVGITNTKGNTGGITIGAGEYPTGTQIFNGSIDDIRIYTRALSAAEIEALYYEGGWPVGDIQGPVISNISISANPQVGNDITVTATVTDPSGLVAVDLHYARGGAAGFTTTPMSFQGNDTELGTIPGSAVTPAGVAYFISAEDNLGNRDSSTIASIQVHYPPGTIHSDVPVSAFPTGFPFNQWRLISFPSDVDDKSVTATIREAMETPSSDETWKLFRYVGPGPDGYVEASTLSPGESYFLKQIVFEEPFHFYLGSGQSVDLVGYTWTLEPRRWSFIAAPYPFPVTVTADQGTFKGPYTYGAFGSGGQEGWSTGQVQTTLKPWGGYIIYNNTDQTRTLEITPPSLAKAPLAKETDEQIDAWLLMITAEGERYFDAGNVIGRIAGASEGLDDYDSPEPPYIAGYVSLAIERPEWSRTAGITRVTSDMRSIEEINGVWDLSISTKGENGPITLRSDFEGEVPADFRIVLLDVITREAYDVLDDSSPLIITDCREEYPYHLKVVAGLQTWVDVEVQEILTQLPTEFALSQNYPNPFNPMTRIQFTLPQPDKISLKVYNLLGQEVATLAEGWLDLGEHEVLWSGSDHSGRPLPSGIYFTRLAGSHSSRTIKMVLLK